MMQNKQDMQDENDLCVSLKEYLKQIDRHKKLMIEYKQFIRKVENLNDEDLLKLYMVKPTLVKDCDDDIEITEKNISYFENKVDNWFKKVLEITNYNKLITFIDILKNTRDQLTNVLNEPLITNSYIDTELIENYKNKIITKISLHSKYFKELKPLRINILPIDVTCMICLERNQIYLVKQKCCNNYCCEECLYKVISTNATTNKVPLCPTCRTPY
jgi:hypothetical protein